MYLTTEESKLALFTTECPDAKCAMKRKLDLEKSETLEKADLSANETREAANFLNRSTIIKQEFAGDMVTDNLTIHFNKYHREVNFKVKFLAIKDANFTYKHIDNGFLGI